MYYRRLRDLREDSDLRQQDIARLLHCPQVCYSYYESGRRDIPSQALVTLAAFYNTSADYLPGRTDRRDPCPAAAAPQQDGENA